MFIVKVKEIGYPNGKIIDIKEYFFESIEEAIDFAKAKEVITPDFSIVAQIFTNVQGHLAVILS